MPKIEGQFNPEAGMNPQIRTMLLWHRRDQRAVLVRFHGLRAGPFPLTIDLVPLRQTVRSSRAGIRNVPQTRRACRLRLGFRACVQLG
jgi:hypothetical protein